MTLEEPSNQKAPLEFEDIDVGGAVTLTGKNKGGDIEVGGWLKVQGELEFEQIEVGGKVESQRSRCKEQEMEVGGSVDVDGSLRLSGIS